MGQLEEKKKERGNEQKKQWEEHQKRVNSGDAWGVCMVRGSYSDAGLEVV